MSMSINTNVGALVALQNVSKTNSELAVTQNRINTGLKVSSTKDDSATYAIAQNLRAEMSGLSSVKSSLTRAKSTLDVAISAAEQISGVLTQMREKATAASDNGLDTASRTALANDFNKLRDQLANLVKSAAFNGTNLLDAASSGQITALMSSQDGNSGTAGYQADTFTVANQDLGLGSGTTAGTNIKLGLASTFTNATEAATMVTNVDDSMKNLNTVLSTLGSASRQIDAQLSFSSKLSDSIETGIGNLVDADLAKESARLQALQVKQQLGLQALSIANQAPQSIMSLFRG